MSTSYKSLIGKEDLSIQTNTDAAETFQRQTSTGGLIDLTKFPDIWDGTGKINVAEIITPGLATTGNPWYDSAAYDSINAAVTAINSTVGTLLVRDSETLTDDLTIPSTLLLVIPKGGSILKASTYTVTINGPFEAGLYQVFSGFDAGDVTFGSGVVKEVYPQWWGAEGDDSTDDTVALTSAIASFPETGGKLSSPPNMTYKVTDGFIIEKCINIDFNNSKIKRYGTSFPTSTVLLWYRSPTLYTRTFSGAVAAGEVDFTLNDSTGLTVGDSVVLQFGEAEYDATQPWLTMFNTVGAIVGNVVTFKVAVPESINTGTDHNCLVLTRAVENVYVKNLQMEDDADAETDSLMYISRCRNFKLENIYIPSAAGALINDQSENVSFDHIVSKRSRYYAGLASSGTFIGGWGFRNFRASNIFGEEVDHNGIYLEGMGRGGSFENIWIQQGTDGSAADYGFTVMGYCKGIHIKNYHYHSAIATSWAMNTDTEGAEVSTENVFLYYASTGFSLERHSGMLGWTDGAGTLLTYYTRTKTYVRKFDVDINMDAEDIGIPEGIYKSVKAYFNSKTGITAFTFGNDSGDAKDVLLNLPDAEVLGRIDCLDLTTLANAAAYPFNCDVNKYAKLTTDETVVAATYGVLEIEYYPLDDDDTEGLNFYDTST